jgi:hypothetical protein
VGVPLLRRVGNRRRRATSPVTGGEGGGWYSVDFVSLFYTYKTSSRLGGEILLVLQIADTNWCALPAFKASRQLELNTRTTRRPCTGVGPRVVPGRGSELHASLAERVCEPAALVTPGKPGDGASTSSARARCIIDCGLVMVVCNLGFGIQLAEIYTTVYRSGGFFLPGTLNTENLKVLAKQRKTTDLRIRGTSCIDWLVR